MFLKYRPNCPNVICMQPILFCIPYKLRLHLLLILSSSSRYLLSVPPLLVSLLLFLFLPPSPLLLLLPLPFVFRLVPLLLLFRPLHPPFLPTPALLLYSGSLRRQFWEGWGRDPQILGRGSRWVAGAAGRSWTARKILLYLIMYT